MSEFEALDLLRGYDEAQRGMIAQVISLHLVMAAATYYFLHRSGVAMKLAVFGLYALGNAVYVALMYNVSAQIIGLRDLLRTMAEAGDVTPITQAVLHNTGASWANASSIITNFSFLALWAGTIYFLFFWKRPSDA